MAVPTFVRAFALGALVATATPVAQEVPQGATCGSDEESADSALLQQVRHVRQKQVPSAETELSAETCTGEFEPYPYLEASLWGTNYVGWETCGGESQSPINLKERRWCHKVEKGGRLRVQYGKTKSRPYIRNNGYHLDIGKNWGTLTTADDTIVKAKSFHFHSPSEHTVNGKAAVAEMHIVHLPEDDDVDVAEDDDVAKDINLLATRQSSGGGGPAVVGILFDLGRANKCLEEAFSELTRASCKRKLKKFNLFKCFKKQLTGDYWFYTGSLTTPPCTEGVEWYVMKNRATISTDQLKLLQSTFLNNARPTQSLNGRKVGFHKVVKTPESTD